MQVGFKNKTRLANNFRLKDHIRKDLKIGFAMSAIVVNVLGP